ncbi:Zinc finger protein 497 [Habropoda laboriosa]|uniref:Zinc finger protein 497 n=1 Tax=Habropoda laboriosa TaxID=597456 RepID=A0A0L7QZI0_9HYME|nr:Zinc finger protein 497 [Habropoda laboriosa]
MQYIEVNNKDHNYSEVKLDNLQHISAQKKLSILEQTKQELKKYCRTCAGLKLPLVDIFSEKGNQMRLSQQIKHLEDINPYDSLSTQMCMDCICDLKMSYKFFMQIKKAEVKLKSIHITLTDTATKNIEASKIQPTESSEKQKENIMECNATNLFLNKENNERTCVPKISAIFSLKNEQEFLKVEKVDSVEESENKTDLEIFKNLVVQQNSDDNESIEEFDPDDPPFQPDNKSTDLHQTTYNYDTFLRAYIKVEDTESNNLSTEPHSMIKSETICNVESAKECLKQPNILKRRLLLQTKRDFTEETDENICQSNISDKIGSHEDFKVQKLNVNNSLNINSNQEDGIMYVTVKGSKPNEILLVKVKKMDKPLEKKDDKSVGKKNFDIKPMEKILKRYETLATKEKDLFPERTKKSEIRGQIIEEQIEEYKKKREKVLGGHANISLPVKLEESQTRYFKRNENQDNQRSFTHIETDSVVNIQFDKDSECNANIKVENDISEIVEPVKEKLTNEKTYVNTEEYLSRLAKLKLKWEEVKKKKEFLQKELDESYTEGNIEKLARILGEKEKNLQDFQDYLKQRKIVITRLKDEDIISLYEDRNNAVLKNSLPDLIDESQPADYIPEEHYLECDYCPETFASKDVLEEHLKMHDYKIMHFCEDCMEEFPTNKAKRNHNVICIKKLLCKYCDMMLDSKGKKRQHEQKHCDSLYGQLCDICGEKFKHQGTLDQHVKTQHMSWEKIYQCPKCPKKFAFKQKLSFHLKSVHTTLRAYLCEDCGADFKNPASLRHHRIRKHQPVGNKRECPVCHKLVPFYSLSKHMHTHKAYTIECPHCDKMFKNSSTLKQHVRIHEDQRQYRCDTCGVGFNRRDGLRLHMRVHEKTDSRGLKECSCQVCGEKFPNHSMLVIHRNRVHKDVRLRHHMMVTHNRLEGTLPCPHCPKRFVNQLRLKTHMISHSEERPYTCEICGFNLKTKIQLIKHHQNRHSDERPLQCRYCPWRCKQVSALVCHERTHTNERPYSCSVCRQRFKYLGDKNKHERRHESLGGSGFKRIVLGRNIKAKVQEDSSCSEHEQEGLTNTEHQVPEGQYQEQADQQFEEQIVKFEEQEIVKFEEQEIAEEYEQVYEQEYEETSREASDAAEVIMNMEDTVYTEEVAADNIEPAEIMTDEMMTNEILQSGAVVHLQQEDDSGKIQVIPVMLSLPDLSDANTEVNLATASIMYNN